MQCFYSITMFEDNAIAQYCTVLLLLLALSLMRPLTLSLFAHQELMMVGKEDSGLIRYCFSNFQISNYDKTYRHIYTSSQVHKENLESTYGRLAEVALLISGRPATAGAFGGLH